MALNTNRTNVDFSFRHVEQVDKLGQSVGGVVATVQSLLDSRAEDNLTDVNNVKTTMRSVTVGDSGAHAIGSATVVGITGNTVHAQISNLLPIAQAAQAGTILPGTVTDVILSDTAGQIKDVVSGHTAELAGIAQPLVCFTFDDGLSYDSLTYSIFKEYGYVAGFGLNTDNVYLSSKTSLNNYKKYEDEGFEIFSHGASHASLSAAVLPDVLQHELQSSAYKLRKLGFSANGFIAPYSNLNASNAPYAKEIYDYILLGGTGLNDRNAFKSKTLTRISSYSQGVAGSKALIDTAIEDKKLLIFYDHGIDKVGSMTEAELRELLTYVQTKVTANLIQVHSPKVAINKYYGIPFKNKAKIFDKTNQVMQVLGWEFENNTMSATKLIDTDYPNNKVLEVRVPSSAAIGTTVTLSQTTNLSTIFSEIGERVRFSLKMKMQNSQYLYFDKFASVSFLESNDTVIHTQTLQLNPVIGSFDEFIVDAYAPPSAIIANIAKVKLSIKIDVSTPPTVLHNISISDVKLLFGEYNETIKTEIITTTLTDNLATPNVTNMEYITVTNTAATTITNFVSTALGQKITLFFSNSDTTIDGSTAGNIRTIDGLDVTPTTGSIMVFYKVYNVSSVWYELSRTIRTV